MKKGDTFILDYKGAKKEFIIAEFNPDIGFTAVHVDNPDDMSICISKDYSGDAYQKYLSIIESALSLDPPILDGEEMDRVFVEHGGVMTQAERYTVCAFE